MHSSGPDLRSSGLDFRLSGADAYVVENAVSFFNGVIETIVGRKFPTSGNFGVIHMDFRYTVGATVSRAVCTPVSDSECPMNKYPPGNRRCSNRCTSFARMLA